MNDKNEKVTFAYPNGQKKAKCQPFRAIKTHGVSNGVAKKRLAGCLNQYIFTLFLERDEAGFACDVLGNGALKE